MLRAIAILGNYLPDNYCHLVNLSFWEIVFLGHVAWAIVLLGNCRMSNSAIKDFADKKFVSATGVEADT